MVLVTSVFKYELQLKPNIQSFSLGLSVRYGKLSAKGTHIEKQRASYCREKGKEIRAKHSDMMGKINDHAYLE